LTPAAPLECEASVGEADMANLLCLVFGDKTTLVPFSSNRFYCRRCGRDLGVNVAPESASVAADDRETRSCPPAPSLSANTTGRR